MEDRIEYFERMLADNPDNPMGLLAFANEYNKVECATKTRRRSSNATWRPTNVSVLTGNTHFG